MPTASSRAWFPIICPGARPDGIYLPDLLPLPYTREAQDVFVRNIDRVQDALGRAILIENPSVYLAFADSEMARGRIPGRAGAAHRLRRAAGRQQCRRQRRQSGRGRRPRGWPRMLDALPAAAIGEIHLAGHAVRDLADGAQVAHRRSWLARQRRGLAPVRHDHRAASVPRPTLIEWDTDIPAFDVLAGEAAQADALRSRQGGAPCRTWLSCSAVSRRPC